MYRPSITGQIVGNREIGDCAKQFEAMGYIKAENLSPAQRAELNPTFKDNTQRIIIEPTVSTDIAAVESKYPLHVESDWQLDLHEL